MSIEKEFEYQDKDNQHKFSVIFDNTEYGCACCLCSDCAKGCGKTVCKYCETTYGKNKNVIDCTDFDDDDYYY